MCIRHGIWARLFLAARFFRGYAIRRRSGPTEEERKWCVEGLRAIGEEAQKCDMLIAAEPLNRFEMHICNTIAQAYDLCSRTELDNVGILADTKPCQH